MLTVFMSENICQKHRTAKTLPGKRHREKFLRKKSVFVEKTTDLSVPVFYNITVKSGRKIKTAEMCFTDTQDHSHPAGKRVLNVVLPALSEE